MNRFISRSVATLFVAVWALGVPPGVRAEVRPYGSRGTAHFTSATSFEGAGIATHLGKYTEVGIVAFSPTDDPTVLRLDGAAIYTAANGDQLYATFTGYLDGVTGAIVANLTYEGGNGRFADATGSSSLAGQLLPDGTLAVGVEGTIDY